MRLDYGIHHETTYETASDGAAVAAAAIASSALVLAAEAKAVACGRHLVSIIPLVSAIFSNDAVAAAPTAFAVAARPEGATLVATD